MSTNSLEMTSAERNLIAWLLENTNPTGATYLDQVEGLRVVSRCNCGCPTIYFAPDIADSVEICHFVSVAEDESACSVMLSEKGGKLVELALHWYGDVPPRHFPMPAELRRFE
jgi:hypothetical protein